MTHADRKTPRAGESPLKPGDRVHVSSGEVLREWRGRVGTVVAVSEHETRVLLDETPTRDEALVWMRHHHLMRLAPPAEPQEKAVPQDMSCGCECTTCRKGRHCLRWCCSRPTHHDEAPSAEPQETAVPCGVCRCCEYGLDCRKPAPPHPADLAERARALSRTVARLYGGADPSPVVTAAIERAITAVYHDGLETGCALPCGHCPEPDLIAEAEARGRAEERARCIADCNAVADRHFETLRRRRPELARPSAEMRSGALQCVNAIERRGEAEKKGERK